MSIPQKNNPPYCSVIVLNYFGEKVIIETLNSLLNLNYPKNRYEIIVVDNNSKDGSKEILLKYVKEYSNVKVFFLKKNLGFSKGNNVGIRQAKGKYICLLNNDCFVDKEWLKELILTAEKDENIFAVSSKVLLYPRFLYLKVKISNDFVIKNVLLKKSNLLKFTNDKEIELTAMWSDDPNDRVFTLEIPYDKDFDGIVNCQINLLTSKSFSKKPSPLKIVDLQSEVINTSCTRNKESYKATLKINVGLILKKNRYDKIQNAGIVVFQEGAGRDIGAIVRYHRQYYEFDKGQFDSEREIYAACGAACLFRKDILDKIGYLDEAFFMYYEDVEISERARLQGYKIYFSPKAKVRHLHALSSKEWSPFFIYNVEKGRYLHLLYYFPYSGYLFVLGFFRLLVNGIVRLLVGSNKRKNYIYNLQYLMLVGYFIANFLKLIYLAARKRSIIPREKLTKHLSTITSGRWYFERN